MTQIVHAQSIQCQILIRTKYSYIFHSKSDQMHPSTLDHNNQKNHRSYSSFNMSHHRIYSIGAGNNDIMNIKPSFVTKKYNAFVRRDCEWQRIYINHDTAVLCRIKLLWHNTNLFRRYFTSYVTCILSVYMVLFGTRWYTNEKIYKYVYLLNLWIFAVDRIVA